MRLHSLYQHAADLGLNVEHTDLGPTRRGDYCERTRVIRLSTRLTRAQAASTLSHEISHALGVADHDRADELGASLIIERDEYAEAEAEVGEHPGALADALDVTPRLILAWRRWAQRKAVA